MKPSTMFGTVILATVAFVAVLIAAVGVTKLHHEFVYGIGSPPSPPAPAFPITKPCHVDACAPWPMLDKEGRQIGWELTVHSDGNGGCACDHAKIKTTGEVCGVHGDTCESPGPEITRPMLEQVCRRMIEGETVRAPDTIFDFHDGSRPLVCPAPKEKP